MHRIPRLAQRPRTAGRPYSRSTLLYLSINVCCHNVCVLFSGAMHFFAYSLLTKEPLWPLVPLLSVVVLDQLSSSFLSGVPSSTIPSLIGPGTQMVGPRSSVAWISQEELRSTSVQALPPLPSPSILDAARATALSN